MLLDPVRIGEEPGHAEVDAVVVVIARIDGAPPGRERKRHGRGDQGEGRAQASRGPQGEGPAGIGESEKLDVRS